MNFLLLSVTLIFIVSCSHHHKEEGHHHHQDTASIPVGDHGNGAYVIKHGGQTYYFDTEEEQDKFEATLKSERKATDCVRRGRQLVCGGK
jgi:hypothetical protein